MTQNPLLNALAASVYIVGVVNLISYMGMSQVEEDTILTPIAMISLFTLSAAVMGYLFVYQPLLLILEGQRAKGVQLFLGTVGVFAVITVSIFLVMVSGAFF